MSSSVVSNDGFELNKKFSLLSSNLKVFYGEIDKGNNLIVNKEIKSLFPSSTEIYKNSNSPLSYIGKPKRKNSRFFLMIGPFSKDYGRNNLHIVARIKRRGDHRYVLVECDFVFNFVVKEVFHNNLTMKVAIIEFTNTSRTCKEKLISKEDAEFSFLIVNNKNGKLNDMSDKNFSENGYYIIRSIFFFVKGSEGNSLHKKQERKRKRKEVEEKILKDISIDKISCSADNIIKSLNRIEENQKKIITLLNKSFRKKK